MADAVVTVALETIRDLLIDEGKFLIGVRDQVEELGGELEALQSFLKDANARKHEDERLRTSVRQAKRLAYRAEDTIEEYAIKVASKRGGGLGKVASRVACIVRECISTHKIGNEIGKLKTEIANLTNRLKDYGVNQIIEAQPSSAAVEKQRRLRTTYAHEVEEYFVGMEEDFGKLVTWVTEDHKIHRVISICGIGGLGKTTIARKVFNHVYKSSQRSFECYAWVSVTQQCQVKMLLQDILFQIVGDKVGDLGEEALVRKLYNELKNKKCFIVLDDIWNLDDWESLRPAFPISEGSSKILLTTRTRDVAQVAHLHHEPKLMDEKDGWDLLTKIAFNLQEDQDQGNTLPEEVVLVGRAMLRKCGGLPLAISLLGGILKTKDPLIEWETVNKKIVSVLAFSYDDLPSYLRPCFLYMGCFREDEDINSTRLYQLWMAEGLISASKKLPGKTLMDVASDFLHELISRNMVRPLVRDESTDNNSCRLHDLMRELCLTKGREEELMEFKSIQIGHGKVSSVCIDGVDVCRQTILVDGEGVLTVGIKLLADETCFIFNQMFSTSEVAIKLKRLRSLILDNCFFKNNKLPKEIREMVHLRYLSLQDSLYDVKLPSFIGDLQYLQTLNLAHQSLIKLPNIFHKMKRLRCLYLPRRIPLSKSRNIWEFHGLNDLEIVEGLDSRGDQFTLSEFINIRRFSATIWSYEELSRLLVQLSSLLKVQYISITFIRGDPRSKLENNFPDVKKLLLCPSLQYLDLRAPIGKFPRYEPQFWPDLVSLKLCIVEFEEDPMPFLQELPNLRELKIEWKAYVGKEMYCSSKAFPKLTSLKLEWLRNIETWRVDAGAFPNLSTLEIGHCRSFKIVPHGFTCITTLTRIDIWDMPEEFKIKYGRLQNTNH